jgi:hypothetical protein
VVTLALVIFLGWFLWLDTRDVVIPN